MKGEKLCRSLESAGLNLFSVLEASQIEDAALPTRCQSVLLIGNAGNDLWQKIPKTYFSLEHPVDEYSADITEQLLQKHLPDVDWEILFPLGTAEPNLQGLGQLAGWHNQSPLGNGVNQRHGLWFAYRAVVAVFEPLTPSVAFVEESPCLSCADTPCITACPAAALTVGQAPKLESCMGYRTAPDSLCAENCIARLSCPVAPQWRYSDEQIRYFYGRSLLSLQQWVSSNAGPTDSD